MKTCKNCGAIMGDLMKKCNTCGAPLEETIRLELEPETFVQPPQFPEDLEDAANEVELSLQPPEFREDPEDAANEVELSLQPPVYPDPPKFPGEAEDADANLENLHASDADTGNAHPDADANPENPHAPDADTGNAHPDADADPEIRMPYYTGPASYTNPRTETSAGGRVNLTQQAINEQKERQKQAKQKKWDTPFHQNKQEKQEQQTSGPQYDPDKAASVTGTTGLVCGLIGLILVVVFGAIGSCTGVGAGSLILTLVGLALSIIGLVISGNDRKATGNTCERANIAFVVSLIGIIIGAVLLLIGISCVGCIGCIGCAAANAIIG